MSPWAIIRNKAPAQPHCVWDIIPAVTRPMWLIEEYAINDFRSVCRRHRSLAIQAPHNLNVRIGVANVWEAMGKKVDMRHRPYPPSFSKMPARIIDPATGASTCALGSHRCTR